MNKQILIFTIVIAILLLFVFGLPSSMYSITEHLDANSAVSTNIQTTINNLQAKIGSINETSQQINNLIKGIQGIPLQNNINDLQSGKPLTPVQIQNVVNNIMSVQNNINNLVNTNTTLSSNITDLNNLVSNIKSAFPQS